MKSEETWTYIHSERAQMADTWAELSFDQWATSSWCEGWTVQDTAGHILAAAEQTPLNFYKEMLWAGNTGHQRGPLWRSPTAGRTRTFSSGRRGGSPDCDCGLPTAAGSMAMVLKSLVR